MDKPKKLKIAFAPQDNIKLFATEIDDILKALGHPEAFVTDPSMIGDFSPEDEEMKALEELLGSPVKEDEYLWEVAQRLYKSRYG